MNCPVCGAELNYQQAEDYGDTGIIEFYQCDNCEKIITISDLEEEEE